MTTRNLHQQMLISTINLPTQLHYPREKDYSEGGEKVTQKLLWKGNVCRLSQRGEGGATVLDMKQGRGMAARSKCGREVSSATGNRFHLIPEGIFGGEPEVIAAMFHDMQDASSFLGHEAPVAIPSRP